MFGGVGIVPSQGGSLLVIDKINKCSYNPKKTAPKFSWLCLELWKTPFNINPGTMKTHCLLKKERYPQKLMDLLY